jgi:hypothetical protein
MSLEDRVAELEAAMASREHQLLEVLSELASLRRELRLPRRRSNTGDAAFVGHLRSRFGARVFRPGEVLADAFLAAQLSTRTLTTQQVGIRLGALAESPPDGRYRVERVTRDSDGWLWTVVEVPHDAASVTVTIDRHASREDDTDNGNKDCGSDGDQDPIG